MIKHVLAVAAILSLSGCATFKNPTQMQAASANYGTPVERDSAVRQARDTLNAALKDPDSAKWLCGGVEKAWVHELFTKTDKTFYGYRLGCLVNAKNSYGAYTGDKNYEFYYSGGELKRIYTYDEGVHDALHMRRVY